MILPFDAPHVNDLLAEALTYAARGWRIIPTHGKRAACLWKQFQASRPDNLEDLFNRPGIDGLAVILGNGLACRDYDDAGAYHRWRDSHPDLAAALPTVRTARGYHVYFCGPEGFQRYPDGEYRADGGHYCLIPPSRHPSGQLYSWVIPLPTGELPIVKPQEIGLLVDPAATQVQPSSNPINPLHCVSLPGESLIFPTLPQGPGQRNRCLFEFARRLKAVMPAATPAELRALVTEWHRQALPVIRTRDFAETWSDFQVAWLRVQKPYRPAGLAAAFTLAVTNPEPPIDSRAELGILAAACRELQLIAGDGPFHLSARAAAKHLCTVLGQPVSATTAWRWLQALQFFGFLTADRKGSLARISGKEGSPMTASTWRYVGCQAEPPASINESPAGTDSLLAGDDMGPYGEGY